MTTLEMSVTMLLVGGPAILYCTPNVTQAYLATISVTSLKKRCGIDKAMFAVLDMLYKYVSAGSTIKINWKRTTKNMSLDTRGETRLQEI